MVVMIAFAAISAVNIKDASVSAFELRRRLQARQPEAAAIEFRKKLLPRLRLVKLLVELLLAMIIAISLYQWNGWVGFFVACGAIFVGLYIARLASFSKYVDRQYEKHEPRIIDKIKNWVWLRAMEKQEYSPPKKIHSVEELLRLAEVSRVVSPASLEMIRHGLSSREKTVGAIMIRKKDIDSISAGENLGPLTLDTLYRSGHSFFPVVDNQEKNIIGFIDLDEVRDVHIAHTTAKKAMRRRVEYIVDTARVDEALRQLLDTRCHMLVVRNKQGEEVGVITLNDTIQSVLGKQFTKRSRT